MSLELLLLLFLSLVTVVGMAVGFTAYFFDLRHSIKTIEAQTEGVLTLEEAEHLTSLYIHGIHFDLLHALDHYLENDYEGHRHTGNVELVMSSMRVAYHKIVSETMRPMVGVFMLRRQKSFEGVLNTVSMDAVERAMLEVKLIFLNAINTHEDEKQTKTLVQNALLTANQEGKQKINAELRAIYS